MHAHADSMHDRVIRAHTLACGKMLPSVLVHTRRCPLRSRKLLSEASKAMAVAGTAQKLWHACHSYLSMDK